MTAVAREWKDSRKITVTAAGAADAGNLNTFAGIPGVLLDTVETGDPAVITVEGAVLIPKQTGFALAVGDPVYVDTDTDQRAESASSNTYFGTCAEAAESGDTEVWVRLSGGAPQAKKNNPAAAARPTANDDTGDGYSIGSLWYYQGVLWICTDATATAAHWRPLNPIVTTATVLSGQTSVSVAIAGITGAANGDAVTATVKTKGANAAYVTGADITGGNLVISVNTDPGTGGAVLTVLIWPTAV